MNEQSYQNNNNISKSQLPLPFPPEKIRKISNLAISILKPVGWCIACDRPMSTGLNGRDYCTTVDCASRRSTSYIFKNK